MDRRSRILNAARNLTLERGVVPSLNSTASAAGVSKGGLIHHFPSRAAPVQGLAIGALEELDAAMLAASVQGRAAEVWLRLSVPTGDDAALFRALAVAHRAVESPGDDVAAAAQEAVSLRGSGGRVGYRWRSTLPNPTSQTRRTAPVTSR